MGGPPPVSVSVPAFAKGFPRDPALDRLVALFEQGNYAQVRKDAATLLKSTEDAAVRRAVKDVLERLRPDPLALYLLVAAAALLAVLAGWYWTHPHALAPAPSQGIVPAPAPVSS
jgi:hypothetical protein